MTSLIKTNHIQTDIIKKKKKYIKCQINQSINESFSFFNNNPEGHDAFNRILFHVRAFTNLLKIPDASHTWTELQDVIRGLKHIACFYDDTIRPLETWVSCGRNGRKLFSSLAHHLLAKFNVPYFMNSVWFKGSCQKAFNQQKWFIGMSRGISIRKLNIPINMSRKMEHLFLQAPDHFTVEEAMRYSQVIGLGGSKNLANAIISTQMGRILDNDDFWRTVIHFFINFEDDMDFDFIHLIIDYLVFIKFTTREVQTDDGIEIVNPPEPNFLMKGRTLMSIMRRVETWHEEFATKGSGLNLVWKRSRINGYQYFEKSKDYENPNCIWNITELLSSQELFLESKTLHHCVKSYAHECSRGKTTIWSMTKEVNYKKKRVLTIEVDPNNRVLRQARGICNRSPGNKLREIMLRWAHKEGLLVSERI